MSIEIKLSRSNRVYCSDEPLVGKILTKLPSSLSHSSIRLILNGSVNMQLRGLRSVRGGSAGVIESLVGVVKPICFLNKSIEIKSSGRLNSGATEIPFSVALREPGEHDLEKFYETYHGANISIQYLLTVDVLRGYLHKKMSATVEFIIECKTDPPELPTSSELILFYITQDTQRHPLLPELKSGGFRVTGKIPVWGSLSEPLNGELNLEASSMPIESIDINLIRVESILVGDRVAKETSLIQSTQIADGDVDRGRTLPIYVILPRLLTCPTIFAGPFSVEFKVSIVISFKSELSKLHTKSDPLTPRLWLAMETLPLELIRTR